MAVPNAEFGQERQGARVPGPRWEIVLRFRRKCPAWIAIHRDDLLASDVALHEGLRVTSVARTVADVLHSSGRTEFVRQAIKDAKRAGLIAASEAARLKSRYFDP